MSSRPPFEVFDISTGLSVSRPRKRKARGQRSASGHRREALAPEPFIPASIDLGPAERMSDAAKRWIRAAVAGKAFQYAAGVLCVLLIAGVASTLFRKAPVKAIEAPSLAPAMVAESPLRVINTKAIGTTSSSSRGDGLEVLREDVEKAARLREMTAAVEIHESGLVERVGLDRDARGEARELLARLKVSESTLERERIRTELIAMGARGDIFKFLGATAVSLPFEATEVVLSAMRSIDRERTVEYLVQMTQQIDPALRVLALETLVRTDINHSPETIRTLSRGMLDLEPSVCIAAAQGLGEIGQTSGTPALIYGMRKGDRAIQEACKTALSRIWSATGPKVSFRTADEWEKHTSARMALTLQSIAMESLEPLSLPITDENRVLFQGT